MLEAQLNCPLCNRIQTLERGDSRLVHEFPHSYLLVGDHQTFPGYCVLVAKEHAREPFDLPMQTQHAMNRELMMSAQAIQKAFQPIKMNYSCYGNQVPHVHWHLFPRYEGEPKALLPPWSRSDEFAAHATQDEDAMEIARLIRGALIEG